MITTTDLMANFCRARMERENPPKRLSPVFLADAFVDFFDLSTFPRMEEITTLLKVSGVEIVGQVEPGQRPHEGGPHRHQERPLRHRAGR